jgi:hypothetical protein
MHAQVKSEVSQSLRQPVSAMLKRRGVLLSVLRCGLEGTGRDERLTLKALGGPEPLPSVPELCSHPVNVQISKWWKVLSIVLCHACCAAVGTTIPPTAGPAAEAASASSSAAAVALQQ